MPNDNDAEMDSVLETVEDAQASVEEVTNEANDDVFDAHIWRAQS